MKPPEIHDKLKHDVIGQNAALREVSVALYKHLIGHTTGNILMIGGSGTGKTTIMRAVEALLDEHPEWADYGTVVRLNANLLADLASRGAQSNAVLDKLVSEARARRGDEAPASEIIRLVEQGIVFVDEVDKIRSHVGEEPNVSGIIAQESFLTLMESETMIVGVPVRTPAGEWQTVNHPVHTGGILFIAGGAFEELYEQVFDRVTAHGKNPPWKLVTKADGTIERRIVFQLATHLAHEDLFKYGITPQFLARFDSIVTLRNLGAKDLIRIFEEIPDSILKVTEQYFEAYGVQLLLTPEAIFFIADKATENPRIGARALKEVFARIIKEYEFDPYASGRVSKEPDGHRLMVDLDMCQKAYSEKR